MSDASKPNRDTALEQAVRMVKALRAHMPFLAVLSPAERPLHRRIDRNIVALLQETLVAARENQRTLPPFFDLPRFADHVQETVALQQCLSELRALTADLQDTVRATATQALFEAQVVRQQLQISSQNTPGLRLVVQRLSPHAFRPKRRRRACSEPVERAGSDQATAPKAGRPQANHRLQ